MSTESKDAAESEDVDVTNTMEHESKDSTPINEENIQDPERPPLALINDDTENKIDPRLISFAKHWTGKTPASGRKRKHVRPDTIHTYILPPPSKKTRIYAVEGLKVDKPECKRNTSSTMRHYTGLDGGDPARPPLTLVNYDVVIKRRKRNSLPHYQRKVIDGVCYYEPSWCYRNNGADETIVAENEKLTRELSSRSSIIGKNDESSDKKCIINDEHSLIKHCFSFDMLALNIAKFLTIEEFQCQ